MLSIIIPHHLEANEDLLRRAVRCASDASGPKEIIVVSDAKERPILPNLGELKLFHKTDGSVDHFSRKINFGARRIDPKSKAIMIFSDDCEAADGTITALYLEALKHKMILNAVSNCDDVNIINPGISGWPVRCSPRDADLDQHHPAYSGHGWIFPTNKLYFYATMIPREIWQDVGELDERFESGAEDLDYSLRATLKEHRLGILSNTFILHWGQQTISKLPVKHNGKDMNLELFYEKWGLQTLPHLTQREFGAMLYAGLRETVK